MPQGRPRFYGGALVEAQQASQCVSFFVFFVFSVSFRGPAISFRFISEVVPRNPGHATHFTKGNENPLGNKLGGGPGGGARTPPASIFKGAYRSRRRTLPFCDIKISLCLLNFEGCGTLDLGEIYQFGPWKRFAFDFRQHPFVRNRSHYTPGATALRMDTPTGRYI